MAMEALALAPAALALAASTDAVTTLWLTLMAFDGGGGEGGEGGSGGLLPALLPLATWGNPRLFIAVSLGDLLLAALLRIALALAPLALPQLLLTAPALAGAVTVQAGLSGYLCAKAVLLWQRWPAGSGPELLVKATGVRLHVPTVLACELLGVLFGWCQLAVVLLGRDVLREPAGNESSLALARRLAVDRVSSWIEEQQQEGAGAADAAGSELTAPLLPLEGGSAAAGRPGALLAHEPDLEAFAAAGGDDGASTPPSFVSATSRPGSSFSSARSTPPATPQRD